LEFTMQIVQNISDQMGANSQEISLEFSVQIVLSISVQLDTIS